MVWYRSDSRTLSTSSHTPCSNSSWGTKQKSQPDWGQELGPKDQVEPQHSAGQLCPLSLPSSEVTHVVMEQTSAEEASCWQERRTVAASLRGCTHPELLDISWFTESMAAGQPVPVERRHRLEVTWVAWHRACGDCPGAGYSSGARRGASDSSAAPPCLQMR